METVPQTFPHVLQLLAKPMNEQIQRPHALNLISTSSLLLEHGTVAKWAERAASRCVPHRGIGSDIGGPSVTQCMHSREYWASGVLAGWVPLSGTQARLGRFIILPISIFLSFQRL